METEEAIMILEYVLGRNKEREGTKMYNNGITLYPDVNRERIAIMAGIEALKKLSGLVEVQVVSAKYYSDKPKEEKTEPEEVQFGEF